MKKEVLLPVGYPEFLHLLKQRVRDAQLKATLAANSELIMLYWDVGKEVSTRFGGEKWGAKIIDRLARDIKSEFADMRGFSPRNLRYMRAFFEAWPERSFLQQAAAKLPWRHHMTLLDKAKTPEAKQFYMQAAITAGWSSNVLAVQIQSGLFERQGRAVTNFERTLPPANSDLAQQTIKDPYLFDFLTLTEPFHEREMENALVAHIRSFLLELGVGFAFVGQQHKIVVGGDEFYMDLLFYHLKLRCFVVIELKTTDFKPEHVGQLNFYLTAVDEIMRHPSDSPTIGLVLCKNKNNVVAEYALRDVHKPIGISHWETEIVRSLPKNLQSSLPSIEQIEEELRGHVEEPTP